jgi:hypothetical protein
LRNYLSPSSYLSSASFNRLSASVLASSVFTFSKAAFASAYAVFVAS